jgi:hypothetical protein
MSATPAEAQEPAQEPAPGPQLPHLSSRWDYVLERWNEPGFTATPEELAGYEKDRVAKQAWQAKRVFYRITGVPGSWENSDLVEALQETFGALPEVYSLSLQTAVGPTDWTQTAILKLHPDNSLDLTKGSGRNIPNSENLNLYISDDFSGLTPLNSPPWDFLAE